MLECRDRQQERPFHLIQCFPIPVVTSLARQHFSIMRILNRDTTMRIVNPSVHNWKKSAAILTIACLAELMNVVPACGQQERLVPRPIMNVVVKGGSFRNLRFSADASRIWTDRLHCWSIATGKQLDSAPMAKPKSRYVFDISSAGNRMLVIHRPSEAIIWDQGKRPRRREFPSKGQVRILRLVGKGDRFVALSKKPPTAWFGSVDSEKGDKSIRLPFEFSRGGISNNGRMLAISKLTDVSCWDLEARKQLQVLKHDSTVFSVAVSPDGRLVATGAAGNLIRIFNMETGKWVATLKGHKRGVIFLTSAVYSLAFSPNGKFLASGGHDGRVIVWDVESGKARLTVQVPSQPIVWSVTFSPDSKLVAGGYVEVGAKHGVGVWRIPPERKPKKNE